LDDKVGDRDDDDDDDDVKEVLEMAEADASPTRSVPTNLVSVTYLLL